MSAQKKTCLFLCVTSLKNFSRVHNCKIFFIVTSYVCCVLSSRFLKVLKCLHIHVELMEKKWLNLSNYFEVHNDSIHVMTKSMKYNIIMILVKSLSLFLPLSEFPIILKSCGIHTVDSFNGFFFCNFFFYFEGINVTFNSLSLSLQSTLNHVVTDYCGGLPGQQLHAVMCCSLYLKL